jgi:hypothetical protein
MGSLRVFKDQHTVRAPRAEDRRETTWWGPTGLLTGPIRPCPLPRAANFRPRYL